MKESSGHHKGKVGMLGVWLAFFIFSYPLFGAGVRLQTGEYFVGDLLGQEQGHYLFRLQGRTYRIPVGDVARLDRKKTKPDIIHTFLLKDGGKVSGLVAREEPGSFTVETINGFEVIPRDKIEKIDYEPERTDDPPARYLEAANTGGSNRVGLFAGAYSLLTRERISHPRAGAVGVFIEPWFLDFHYVDFGVSAEYMEAPGRQPLVLGLGFLYATGHREFTPLWRFYLNFGAGGAAIEFKERAGTAPAAFLAAGWSPALNDLFALRLGLRGVAVYEQGRPTSIAGLEFSLLVKF